MTSFIKQSVYLFGLLCFIAYQSQAQSLIADTSRVGIGVDNFDNFPEDTRLFINGNLHLADSSDIIGVAKIVGNKGIEFSADSSRESSMELLTNGRVLFKKEVGINQQFSFIDLNVRNQAGNSTVFQVEDTTGKDIFEVNRNGNVGINQITNNVTLQVRNKTNGDNNIIANFERANGDNVLQVQDDKDVVVTGDFSVNNGNKNFIMDHPLDPANKVLAHNAVEAPYRVTFYHGNVVLDNSGAATVHLPTYFDTLNTNFHYQLTCIGGFGQVYISSEIQNNTFSIAGGQEGLKVSWQVTAERNDPWAKNNPYEWQWDKEGDEVGKYYYPQGYGKDDSYKIGMDDSDDGADPQE